MTERDRRWLEEARRFLAETCGLQLGQVRVIVAYAISKEGVEFTLPPSTDEHGRMATRFTTLLEEEPPVLAPRDREILEALGNDTLIAKKLAKRLNASCTSWFRTRLARLRREGLLDNTGRGFCVTALGQRALAATHS